MKLRGPARVGAVFVFGIAACKLVRLRKLLAPRADLARIGEKYSDEWHVAHLTNPRALVPESIMPAYDRLSLAAAKIDDLGAHLATLRIVGVPYADEMIANARSDAFGQARPDSSEAEGVARRCGAATNVRAFSPVTGDATEMEALVACLQILGHLTDAAQKPQASAAEAK